MKINPGCLLHKTLRLSGGTPPNQISQNTEDNFHTTFVFTYHSIHFIKGIRNL